MSTRAVIARPDPQDRMRWRRTSVQHDGYPGHVGSVLYAQIVTRFQGDVEAAAAHYIDAHPGGWCLLDEAFGRNECYCHDHGHDLFVTGDETDFLDWTYVLRPEGLEVHRSGYGPVATVPWDAERVDWAAIQRLGA